MKTYEKVRKLREDNHLNQEQMAEMLHISPSSYAKMERGEIKISIERLQQIANIFNVDIKELLDDEKGIVNVVIVGDNSQQYQIGNKYQNLANELNYKDQIIQEKEQTIKSLEREILSLQKVIELLENKEK